MDNALHIFLEECDELIMKLESSIMELESDMDNTELIQEIFRAMHTIKGNSKMFGYENLSDYTHELENIYDAIREGQISVNKELIQLTFESIDLIRSILADSELKDPNTRQKFDQSLGNLSKFLINQVAPKTEANGIATVLEEKSTSGTYVINFAPNKNILKSGNNPLYIIEDLKDLGETLIRTNSTEIPKLQNLVMDEIYLSWEIVLYTDKSKADIEDVFLFVIDDCQLEISKISENNILSRISSKQKEAYQKWELEISDFKEKKLPKISKNETIEKATSNAFIKVPAKKLDQLLNTVSELITSQARLISLAEESHSGELAAVAENIDKISRKLREDTFSICLVQVSSLANKFTRMIRDLSVSLNKKVNFSIETGETEIDKNLVDKLSDPLMHILRNSADHGLESEEDRIAAGKSPEGTIQFQSFYAGTNVVIRIKDDGKGLDFGKILEKARSKGLVETENPTEEEIIDYLFSPGFSTASAVTDVSGRGVGLDVVRRNIEELKGSIKVTSEHGKGTQFDIRLPLTLSIVDGLLVGINQTKYTIPLSYIISCHEVEAQVLENSMDDTVVIEGTKYPFIHLPKHLNNQGEAAGIYQVILIKHERTIAFVVDEILQNHQAVIQPMGDMYTSDMFSGASILGDGTVSLVFDCNEFIDKYLQSEVVA